MSVREALSSAAADFYQQSWRLAILNTVLGLMLVAVVLAVFAARPAVVLAVLVGPFAAAVMHCAVTLAETEELRLAEVLNGLRRCWRRGLALAALLVAGTVLGFVAVPFYARMGVWGWPLAAISAYLLAAFLVFQLALWPLAVARERSFGELLREAARAMLKRPFGFAGLAIALLIVNAVGFVAAVLPFLTLTIAFSFLASAHFSLAREA